MLIILISKALSAIFISDDKDNEILKDVQRRFEDISRHIFMIS